MTSCFVFQDIFFKMDEKLASFALEKSHAIAFILDPVITPALGILWMLYGTAHLTGQIEQPFISFVEKTIKTGLVVSAAVGVAGWNDLLIQTIQDSPVALASAFVGKPGAITTLSGFGIVLDGTMDNVAGIAANFFSQWLYVYPIVLGTLVFIVGIAITVAAGVFIVLSKVATAVLLSFAPLFILALLFQWSKNYFTSYLDKLISFSLLAVIAVAANSFILSMFQQVATSLAAVGGSATLVECATLLITGVFGGVILWQVPHIAAGLAGNSALATAGIGRVIGGGAWNKASNKEGRENQKTAKTRLDVDKRMDAIKEKAARKPDGNNYMKRKEMPKRRTGTND